MPHYYNKRTVRRPTPGHGGTGGYSISIGGSQPGMRRMGGGYPSISTGYRRSAPPAPTPSNGSIPVKRRAHEVLNKTFSELKEECKQDGDLFVDPEFPPDDSSLFYQQRPRMRMEWKRPHEICENPKLFVEGASRFDIMQGELGDCWLLAAMASLSLNTDLLARIIPDDQNFQEEYHGIFHFQFWQYGVWTDVIIDDYLPTYNGRLVYLHSAESNEFWSALLEKAYAKLNGSYEALKGGSVCEAMEDFTGGLTELIEPRNPPKNLWRTMMKSLKKGALMGCAIETKQQQARESKLPNGLLVGHAYSITGIEKLPNGTKLLRVRNPWGQVEWNGAWSDHSHKWDEVPGEKERLDVEKSEDGEFWMSFDDFCKCFTKLEICNLGPDALVDEDESHEWVTSHHEGRWVRGCTAGGCRNFPDTFWVNPQYRLDLEEEDDDPDDDEKGCSFIVSLMQKNRRKQKAKGQGLLTMGFAIYRLTENIPTHQTLKKDFFLYNASTARSKNFINMREVSERFCLPPGHYIIVPSTFQPNEEADFILRIFTEQKSNCTSELDEETKQTDVEPPPPPPEEEANDAKFKMLFEQLTGEDGEIDAFELQDIINSVMKKNAKTGTFDGFSMEACRSMVALTDVTMSGKLNYDEFKTLWVVVRKWISIFKEFDKDDSGSFDTFELRNALSHAGYSLSSRLYQMLCIRYAGKKLTINMDDFVLLAVRLETMFASFKEFKGEGKDANISLQNWLITTMYS